MAGRSGGVFETVTRKNLGRPNPRWISGGGVVQLIIEEMMQHESIIREQRRLARRYQDAKPSQTTDVFWIYAERLKGSYPELGEKGGKWLVFVPIAELDRAWAKIKQATEEGRLGGLSKVATARPNRNAADPGTKVICVYTYDWTDAEDVRRVRAELRSLGITQKIPYKADEDTLSGRYLVAGHKRISKYFA